MYNFSYKNQKKGGRGLCREDRLPVNLEGNESDKSGEERHIKRRKSKKKAEVINLD